MTRGWGVPSDPGDALIVPQHQLPTHVHPLHVPVRICPNAPKLTGQPILDG